MNEEEAKRKALQRNKKRKVDEESFKKGRATEMKNERGVKRKANEESFKKGRAAEKKTGRVVKRKSFKIGIATEKRNRGMLKERLMKCHSKKQ